ncbi:hypothetical protein HELRODRAFT_179427 [Helobdella robusta]|uniref:Uncharacterized protein n=1 Tax=Helobdella robusta TaxID=6412 RepID=T1FEP2_HELRO|nr:hypothetical protein HELRODRAFT_179427 [Helobdella robusta]ESN95357.1 hypothetical protein HELRODRAFT_179427 [Helobdella robusta]
MIMALRSQHTIGFLLGPGCAKKTRELLCCLTVIHITIRSWIYIHRSDSAFSSPQERGCTGLLLAPLNPSIEKDLLRKLGKRALRLQKVAERPRWVLRSALNFASDGKVVREVASAREQNMEIYKKRKGHEKLVEQQS